ncbi:YheT family hydrolase [Candidatus Neomarinimicrobiota bacterium]
MQEIGRELILCTSEGAKLQAYYSEQTPNTGRGMVILLPGWEGSESSVYMQCTGRSMFGAGYDVVRINYRDHGRSHHLNEGLFLGTLLPELQESIAQVVDQHAKGAPVYVVGFSLGGNFALRLACAPPVEINKIYAVSPVLYPLEGTRKLDETPIFQSYFRQKWSRSLARKARLFPERYDFTDVLEQPSIMAMTEILLERLTDYASVEDYFRHYTLTPEYLADARVDSLVITSTDDPVLEDGDYSRYDHIDRIRMLVQSHGGHVGFIRNRLRTTWYEPLILNDMDLGSGG